MNEPTDHEAAETVQTTSDPAVDPAAACSALRRLLTTASLMRIAIRERATFLTKTTDWERLEDAMRVAQKVLKWGESDPNTTEAGTHAFDDEVGKAVITLADLPGYQGRL